MVSFQCDACSDVVKKPKLEQHYGRCGAPVSCIDCSKTFYSPAEFKSHTSCISEAEKYEKSVYQGPKSNSQSKSSDMNKSGRGGFGGGRGSRPARAFGTGVNDIALGANAKSFSGPLKLAAERTDAVAPTPVLNGDAVKLSKKERKQEKYKAKEESLTVVANETAPPELTAASIPNDNSEEPKKPKSALPADPRTATVGAESGIKVDADGAKKKSKKRKSAVQDNASIEAPIPTSVPTPADVDAASSTKKSKKRKSLGAEPEPSPADVGEDVEPKPKKSKQNKPTQKSEEIREPADDTSWRYSPSVPSWVHPPSPSSTRPKKKKKSKHVDAAASAPDAMTVDEVPPSLPFSKSVEGEDAKNSGNKNTSPCETADVLMADGLPTGGVSKKKSKKEKDGKSKKSKVA